MKRDFLFCVMPIRIVQYYAILVKLFYKFTLQHIIHNNTAKGKHTKCSFMESRRKIRGDDIAGFVVGIGRIAMHLNER